MPVNLEERVQYLERDDALRLWHMRELLAHRRINAVALSQQLGRSEQWVRSVLNLSVPLDTEQRLSTWRDWMDRIDQAVDTISLTRGGFRGFCGCSASAIADMSELLKTAREGIHE